MEGTLVSCFRSVAQSRWDRRICKSVSVRSKDDTSKSQISALAYVVLQGQGVTDPGTQVVRVFGDGGGVYGQGKRGTAREIEVWLTAGS
jgi:hypothetical protein